MKHGKKYVDGLKLIDRSKFYDTDEALDLCVKTGTAKFDETVEVHVKLGVDSRHADQQVRGAIVLPNGTGKTVRVLAICKVFPVPFSTMKVGFDVTLVVVSCMLSLVFAGGISGVREGTLAAALLVGVLTRQIRRHLSWVERWFNARGRDPETGEKQPVS